MSVAEKMIKPFDRCDSCTQKAVFMATFVSGDLYFCGHHFHKNEESLVNEALNIYTEFDDAVMESEALDTQ